MVALLLPQCATRAMHPNTEGPATAPQASSPGPRASPRATPGTPFPALRPALRVHTPKRPVTPFVSLQLHCVRGRTVALVLQGGSWSLIMQCRRNSSVVTRISLLLSYTWAIVPLVCACAYTHTVGCMCLYIIVGCNTHNSCLRLFLIPSVSCGQPRTLALVQLPPSARKMAARQGHVRSPQNATAKASIRAGLAPFTAARPDIAVTRKNTRPMLVSGTTFPVRVFLS